MKIQTLEKTITTPNQTVKISDDIDKDFQHLTGIGALWTMGKHNVLINSSISTRELFPRNFPVAFIQSNTYVSPNDRFFKVDEKVNGERIELEYKDGGNHGFYPYVVQFFLRLEDCKK